MVRGSELEEAYAMLSDREVLVEIPVVDKADAADELVRPVQGFYRKHEAIILGGGMIVAFAGSWGSGRRAGPRG